ncbi:hypothetical protein [Aquilutibacter rugosus]|uniref:hypothetical protein n=1 Tax=Aquilutibacter rugosus TaxID=3115820 RepID=UPI002F405814
MSATLKELDEVLANGDVFDRARFLVAYAAEIRAALELKARMVDVGWVLVPREPTETMLQAADDAIRTAQIDTPHGKLVREPTSIRYAAMLNAAPPAQENNDG